MIDALDRLLHAPHPVRVLLHSDACPHAQVEYLYPPLTYLRPTGRVYEHRFGDGEGTITVVQVEPIMA